MYSKTSPIAREMSRETLTSVSYRNSRPFGDEDFVSDEASEDDLAASTNIPNDAADEGVAGTPLVGGAVGDAGEGEFVAALDAFVGFEGAVNIGEEHVNR